MAAIVWGWGLAALFCLATIRLVYRGGRSVNDHVVAIFVTACVGVYPVLWTGFVLEYPDLSGAMAMGSALALGPAFIYGLFVVLERRVEAGPWMVVAILSQPFYTFSLLAGIPLLIWMAIFGTMRLFGQQTPNLYWPGLWLFIPLAMTIWATVWTYWRHGLPRRIDLVMGCAPSEIRLVHLSDVHASPCMTGEHLKKMVKTANSLSPDAVLITGDHVMPFSEAHHSYLIEALKELKAPFYCCAGNHDLPILQTLVAEIESIGGRFLVDESVALTLEQGRVIEIAGVNFHWKNAAGEMHASIDAMSPPGNAALRVLMAHDPRLFKWLPDGRFDLMLSGHTHGGQAGTDMLGLEWSVLRPFGVFDQGLFQRGRSRLYVHRGNWHTGLPPRIGIAAEVVLLRIRSEKL